ncbi:hypothetical protein [Neokomagataea anthophila]|uniref:DUF1436 family protein n=1 Tax=Neokomagataea anthophila TaxID=2826925 RepID=A0ABS5E4P9_9PROT|nr:hypothetical protein [Neokomagataea anthophila]MBR0558885.1 hypothetical protein [Neokomagataea anthophila]
MTKRKSSFIYRSKKFYAIISSEIRGGNNFSSNGWAIYTDRKYATPQWIGENFRRALHTSDDMNEHLQYHPEDRESITEKSNQAFYDFWEKIVEDFQIKDWRTAVIRTARVFSSWDYENTDQIELTATRGSGGGHGAWDLDKNDGKIFHASIHDTDEVIGEVVLKAFGACKPNYA